MMVRLVAVADVGGREELAARAQLNVHLEADHTLEGSAHSGGLAW
jgi:hypothetical protein